MVSRVPVRETVGENKKSTQDTRVVLGPRPDPESTESLTILTPSPKKDRGVVSDRNKGGHRQPPTLSRGLR